MVAGALNSPKGLTLNWYKPYGVVKAVFSQYRVSISSCQYPLARSSVENHCAPVKASNVSLILDRGCASFWVTLFSCRLHDGSMMSRCIISFPPEPVDDMRCV
ncbi:hypothetical protein T02_12151 [Trichinella nativa]|uniref:Uncharacterized protein n=1 Tax=Trichinella nativa TaxID=6335 RepID=A0A0V1L9W6_9BILA|nr:hypothetical protein T02_12151 [Trichinella nativa]